MRGKRASYLHPIRMYVFSSAIFFLLFFSVFKPVTIGDNYSQPISSFERTEYIKRLQDKLQKDTGNVEVKASLLLALDTSHKLTRKDVFLEDTNNVIISFSDVDYRTKEEYDSVQQAKPKSKRDGWIMRRLVHKQIEINTKYKDEPDLVADKFFKSVLHRLPYMLFVSLPLFALILKLMYIRRKKFYYADHGVFTIHLYVFTFLLLMAVFGIDKLREYTNWSFLQVIGVLLFISLFVYLLLAMKWFYEQGWGKTILKFLIVSILSLIMMLVLLVLFMFFSAVTF